MDLYYSRKWKPFVLNTGISFLFLLVALSRLGSVAFCLSVFAAFSVVSSFGTLLVLMFFDVDSAECSTHVNVVVLIEGDIITGLHRWRPLGLNWMNC